jgi:hypothetical protein
MKLLIMPQSLSLCLMGVCVVWAGFLQEHMEVVHGWPHLMLVVAHGGCGAPHARAAASLSLSSSWPIVVVTP